MGQWWLSPHAGTMFDSPVRVVTTLSRMPTLHVHDEVTVYSVECYLGSLRSDECGELKLE